VVPAVSTCDPIGEHLRARSVVILDGALATELERRGADLFDPLWSAKYLIEQPELIRAVHLDYFVAGADVATTATYQATFEGCLRHGIGHDAAAQLMRDAVALARDARDEFWNTRAQDGPLGCEPGGDKRLYPLVAASIGPYGAMLADGSEYRGHYAISDRGLLDFHRPRLQVLADAGADLLAFETVPCLREALVLAQLLAEFPSMTAWLSFSCQDGTRTSEGEDVGACAAALSPFTQLTAIGVNCTRPQYVASLLRRMARQTDKPLMAYPNSGEHYDEAKKTWCGSVAARSFAGQSCEWHEAGARMIGGCCRTTPADIKAIRDRAS
jgi:homocysteine S-methyltransferase